MARYLAMMLFLGVLTACSADPQPANPPPPIDEKPTVGLLDEQMKAIDKAKQVEADAAERKRKMDEQIDDSSN